MREIVDTDWPLFLKLGKVSCEGHRVILLWQMTGPLTHIQRWRRARRTMTLIKAVTRFKEEIFFFFSMAKFINSSFK